AAGGLVGRGSIGNDASQGGQRDRESGGSAGHRRRWRAPGPNRGDSLQGAPFGCAVLSGFVPGSAAGGATNTGTRNSASAHRRTSFAASAGNRRAARVSPVRHRGTGEHERRTQVSQRGNPFVKRGAPVNEIGRA